MSDWLPGAWRHDPALAPAERERWKRLAEEGDRRRRSGDCRGALAAFRAAARIDRRSAALHYARALCLQQRGHWSAARAAYRRASDMRLKRGRAEDEAVDALLGRVVEGRGSPNPRLLGR